MAHTRRWPKTPISIRRPSQSSGKRAREQAHFRVEPVRRQRQFATHLGRGSEHFLHFRGRAKIQGVNIAGGHDRRKLPYEQTRNAADDEKLDLLPHAKPSAQEP